MTIAIINLIAELFLIVVIVLYSAYLVAVLDMWLIKRRARKEVEAQRIIDRLTRKYD